MPKERKDRSVSAKNLRASPYRCSDSHSKRSLNKKPSENEVTLKEWEDARCPVCMEHPHNAILLLCSSHDKGCRPFMCDTSYRHSNCFDQFKKSLSLTEENVVKAKSKLSCPLCRGEVNGTVVVDEARSFMNSKTRSCASETCEFSGTYGDLRKHARNVHPFSRPSQADPERERDWCRMERQRDFGDLLSSFRSALREDRDEDSNSTSPLSGGGSRLVLTILFPIWLVRSGHGSRSSSSSGDSPARAQMTARRRSRRVLFGESYDDESRDDDDESSDGVESGSGPRRSH